MSVCCCGIFRNWSLTTALFTAQWMCHPVYTDQNWNNLAMKSKFVYLIVSFISLSTDLALAETDEHNVDKNVDDSFDKRGDFIRF